MADAVLLAELFACEEDGDAEEAAGNEDGGPFARDGLLAAWLVFVATAPVMFWICANFCLCDDDTDEGVSLYVGRNKNKSKQTSSTFQIV